MRTKLDEFALQGMERWVSYLFYTGTLEEVATLQFLALPDTDEPSDNLTRE